MSDFGQCLLSNHPDAEARDFLIESRIKGKSWNEIAPSPALARRRFDSWKGKDHFAFTLDAIRALGDVDRFSRVLRRMLSEVTDSVSG